MAFANVMHGLKNGLAVAIKTGERADVEQLARDTTNYLSAEHFPVLRDFAVVLVDARSELPPERAALDGAITVLVEVISAFEAMTVRRQEMLDAESHE